MAFIGSPFFELLFLLCTFNGADLSFMLLFCLGFGTNSLVAPFDLNFMPSGGGLSNFLTANPPLDNCMEYNTVTPVMSRDATPVNSLHGSFNSISTSRSAPMDPDHPNQHHVTPPGHSAPLSNASGPIPTSHVFTTHATDDEVTRLNFKGKFWDKPTDKGKKRFLLPGEKFTEVIGKNGSCSERLVVDGVTVNAKTFFMENRSGNRVHGTTYPAYVAAVQAIIEEADAENLLPADYQTDHISADAWKWINTRIFKNFPEFTYCNGNWKLREFFRVYLPNYKTKGKRRGSARDSEFFRLPSPSMHVISPDIFFSRWLYVQAPEG